MCVGFISHVYIVGEFVCQHFSPFLYTGFFSFHPHQTYNYGITKCCMGAPHKAVIMWRVNRFVFCSVHSHVALEFAIPYLHKVKVRCLTRYWKVVTPYVTPHTWILSAPLTRWQRGPDNTASLIKIPEPLKYAEDDENGDNNGYSIKICWTCFHTQGQSCRGLRNEKWLRLSLFPSKFLRHPRRSLVPNPRWLHTQSLLPLVTEQDDSIFALPPPPSQESKGAWA